MKKRLLSASFALACAAGVGAQTNPPAPAVISSSKSVALPPGAMVMHQAGQPPIVVLPDGRRIPLEAFQAGEDVEAGDAPQEAAPQEAAPQAAPAAGDAAIAPYLQMQPFPRQPKDVLKALADGAPKEPAADAPEPAKLAHAAQVLRWRLIAGDWTGFAKGLEALPEGEPRTKVYEHARKLLAAPNVALSADDVIAIVDAAPAAPTAVQLRELGALLARAGQSSGAPLATLQRLEAGTKHLGGAESTKRLAAARLLLAAGMPAEAQPYLPSLEDARANANPAVILLHGEALQRSAKDGESSPLDQAFQLVVEVLESATLDDETRDGALRLATTLLDDEKGHRGDAWLRGVLAQKAELGRRLVAAIAGALEESAQQVVPAPRTSALRVASLCGKALSELPLESAIGYGDALDLLTSAWLLEAGHAIYPDGNVPNPAPPQSPAWFERQQLQQVLQERRKKNQMAIAVEPLLALVPQDSWLARLDGDVAERVRRYEGLLACSARLEDRAIALVQREAARNEPLARELVDFYLMSWTRGLQRPPNFYYNEDMYSSSSYYGGGSTYYANSPQGVPLTRAKQERNLDDLARLSKRFEDLGFPFTDQSLAGAFGACHSMAEVYREEDFERVFGDPSQLSPVLAVQLAGDMRRKLAGQWRKPGTQAQAQTKRTTKETAAEVTRGYELARQLLEQVAANVPDDQGLESMIGLLLYDQAEFLYGQKVDLKIYIALRDEAFRHLQRGAEAYQKALLEGRAPRVNAEAYRMWFNAAMGASDLAYLTRQEKPDLDQVAAVGSRLRALPKERVSEHLEAFAQALANGSHQVPPQLKPHYFRQALRILGDTKAGKQITEALRTYDELLHELELVWEIDGSAKVGSGREFGVLLALRHTRSIERESGGFHKYLRNKVYSNRTGQQVDYRDQFLKACREQLVQNFDIKSELPFEPDAGKLGDERYGWERTPIFYFVLAAKDAAVDRLPSVSMDVDFNDAWGYVLLPVEAKEIPIDARAAEVAARPVTKVEVSQTFDDRKLEKERLLRIEVRASGRGLLPPLEQLVDKTPPAGFVLKSVQDAGLVLNGVDREDGFAVLCERSGALEFELPERAEPAREIAFPKVLVADAGTKYQRFADADLKQVESVVALQELSFLSPERWGLWAFLGACTLAMGLGLWLWQRKLRAAAAQVGRPRYAPLREPNAFGAVALLKRLATDPACAFDSTQRRELESEIERIQRDHFAPNAPRPGDELLQRVNRWLERA
ncbi:MAG: hypothetical protein JNM84_08625 [Planctomycetes bacterium]|nr:hypothetical protein [Planctomycetota bacterium]